jgi:RHS repeat-associated protein
LLSATSQDVLARYHYDPFGNELSRGGPLAHANVYRFSSKERHPQSGLYYYGARFYEPGLQRWLNRDPLGGEGGINLHAFVHNDPINWIDTDGFAPARGGGNSGRSGGGGGSGGASRPTQPTGPGGTWTRNDIKEALARERSMSRLERFQEQMEQDAIWRQRIGRPLRPGETVLGPPGMWGTPCPKPTPQPAPPAPPTSQSNQNAPPNIVLNGQLHHAISRTIYRQLERNEQTQGLYRPRDPQFTTQAKDPESHRGYQGWHRDLDAEVSLWIRLNEPTQEQFENYVRQRYQQPDLRGRFPCGLK